MNSAKLRDLSVAFGIVGGLAACAWNEIGSELRHRRVQAAAKENEPVFTPFGEYGDLWRVTADYKTGYARSTYVRPATADEQKTSMAAFEIDGGPGIFGVTRDGGRILPDDVAWSADLKPGTADLNYYWVD